MGKLTLLLSFIAIISCNNKQHVITSVVEGSQGPYVDRPFEQEYHDAFIIDGDNLDANDVRAIQPDLKDNIWIATKNGVYQKNGNSREWISMIKGADQGPAYDIEIGQNGKVWIATWNGVYSNRSGKIERENGPTPPIAKIVTAQEGVYALGPYGIWLFEKKSWVKKNFKSPGSMREVLSDKDEGLWIGTDVGLYHCNDAKTQVFQKNDDLISAYVQGMDFDDQGNMWVGGLGGITIRDTQDNVVGKKEPKDGLVNSNVRVVRKAPDGKMWVGTEYGITRFNPGEETYSVRLGKRWLVSNIVNDIDFDGHGNAWIATSNGVSAIKTEKMTLSGKADYFYKRLIRRHVRDPWIIARSRLAIPGDTTSIEPDDDDNDGEYTANYLAMESFRYAVTKDPQAKERAKKAFGFLQYLREVTDSDGFFARTIIPVSWEQSHDMDRTYTDRELAEMMIEDPRQKPVEVRWHISKDGKWKWKGDTSSDELCGHLFGYYWYYNLAADDNEKQRIATHFSKIMDHLIRNDFNLVDVDGKHTRWGVWSPKLINHDPDWAPEKALNSLELLSFLKFTYFITKDEKYQNEYLKLIKGEGYLENAKMLYPPNPAWETYFDIYMTMYIYPPLIAYEEDPQLKKEYQDLLNQWFRKNRTTKSPMVNFTYNILSGGADELDSSIDFLKDVPLDLVNWYIDNGKREDLKVVREPILEELQVALRPPSEYRTVRWDKNPYLAASGNPSEEWEPVFWLLPYWMGRYLDLIQNE